MTYKQWFDLLVLANDKMYNNKTLGQEVRKTPYIPKPISNNDKGKGRERGPDAMDINQMNTKLTCFNCGKAGHKSDECRLPKDKKKIKEKEKITNDPLFEVFFHPIRYSPISL